MGLTELNADEFMKLQELVKLLSVFGITEEDLRYLPEALKIVKNGGLVNTPKTMSKEEKKNLEEKMQKTLTPEEFMSQFKGDIEEFYPNGRNKTNDK
jgi:hypothetical protein